MSIKYKRFMVFVWSEYDNVAPFNCVQDSFDSIEDAMTLAFLAGGFDEESNPLFCIFDRQEGVIV